MSERLTDEQVEQVVDELIRRLAGFNDYPYTFTAHNEYVMREAVFDGFIKALKRGRTGTKSGGGQ